MSVSFHLGRKLVLSWLAMATGLLSGMVLYRIQLHSLGSARLGTWVAISSACSYLSLLELGLSGALNRYVATVSGPDDKQHSQVLLSTALRMYLVLMLITVAGSLLLCGTIGPLLRIPLELRQETRYLPALLGLDVAVTLLSGALRGILNGRTYSEVTSAVTLLRHLCYSVTTIMALRHGVGLVGLSLLVLGADALAGVVLLATVAHSGVSLRGALRTRPALQVARALLGFSGVATLAYAGQLLLRQAALPLLSRSLGPEVVVGYAAAGRLALVFFMLMTHTGSVLTPLWATALARGAISWKQALPRAARLSVAVGIPPMLAILCLASALLRTWLGSGMAREAGILHIMGLGMLGQLIGLGTDVAHYASGGLLTYGLAKLGCGVLALVAIVVGARVGAASGAALGNAVVVLWCDAFVTPLLVCRALGSLPLHQYYAALFQRGATLLPLVPLAVLTHRLGAACVGLSQLLPLAAAVTLLGWLLLYTSYLHPEERELIRGRARALPRTSGPLS